MMPKLFTYFTTSHLSQPFNQPSLIITFYNKLNTKNNANWTNNAFVSLINLWFDSIIYFIYLIRKTKVIYKEEKLKFKNLCEGREKPKKTKINYWNFFAQRNPKWCFLFDYYTVCPYAICRSVCRGNFLFLVSREYLIAHFHLRFFWTL